MSGAIKQASLRLSLLDNVTGPALKVATALKTLDAKIAAFTAKRDRAMADFQKAATQAAALAAAVTLPTLKAAAFESSLEDIRQKIDGTIGDVQRLNDAIRSAGKLDGIGAQRAAQTMDALIGLGASDSQAREMSRPVNRAAVAYRADPGELSQAVYSSSGSFGIAAAQTAKALDILAEAGKRGAVELKDQARILPSLSAQYGALGQKGLPALADLAAQLQIVRKGTGTAEEAATSLQNFYSSLTGPEASKRLRGAGINLGKLQAQAEESGGSLVDLILDAIAKKTGGNAEKLAKIFPDRESQRAIRPLMAHRGELSSIRAGAFAADGTVERDFESRMATLEGKWQRLMAGLEEVTLSIGDKFLPVAKQVVDVLIQATDKLDAFVDKNGALILGATKAAAALVGLRLASAGVRLAVWSTVLPVAQAARAIGGLGLAAYGAAAPMLALQAALKGSALTGFEKLAVGLRGLALAVPGVGALGSALAGVGAALAAVSAPAWAGIAAAVAAVAAAGFAAVKYWDRLSAIFSGVGRAIGEQLAPAVQLVRPALDALAPIGDAIASGWERARAALSAFGEWLSGFFSREVLTDGQKAGFEAAGYRYATALIEGFKSEIGRLFDFIAGIPDRIRAAIGNIDLSGMIRWPSLPGWLGGASSPSPAPAPAVAPVAGARAKGGPVRSGLPYLVGEQGPEIFRPARAGTIVPNHQLGGGAPISLTINQTLNINGSSAADLQQLARDAARQVVGAVTSALEGGLKRSPQTAFGGVKSYDRE